MKSRLKNNNISTPASAGLESLRGNRIAVSMQDLTVAYNTQPVLWDIDMDIPEGVLMGIVGPNGAGKSTLIKAALGLVPLAAGSITFFGKGYKQLRSRVAYMPQRRTVDWDFPTTLIDLVEMGLYGTLGWIRPPGRNERSRAMQALEMVGLKELAKRQISQLSGGQQQRSFLARALVQNADIYFMDEPFAAVDALTEESILAILQELRTQGKTVVVVHHDLQTVAEYFDWVALLNTEIVNIGPVQEVFTREAIEQTYGGKISTFSALPHFNHATTEIAE